MNAGCSGGGNRNLWMQQKVLWWSFRRCFFHLAVVSFGANLSVHVLLVQRGRDAEAVAHAEGLCPAVHASDLHRAIQDDVPQVQLRGGGHTSAIDLLDWRSVLLLVELLLLIF